MSNKTIAAKNEQIKNLAILYFFSILIKFEFLTSLLVRQTKYFLRSGKLYTFVHRLHIRLGPEMIKLPGVPHKSTPGDSHQRDARPSDHSRHSKTTFLPPLKIGCIPGKV